MLASHVDSSYGSAPRLPFTGFLVWGLLTFWVYPAIRLAVAWREHTSQRWHEFRSMLAQGAPNEQRLSDLQARGFSPGVAAPYAAAAAYALSGIMVAGWFVRWIVLAATLDYREIMIAVGLSALLFYAATCTLALWLARRIEAHELAELLVVEHGAAAVEATRRVPSGEMVARWEQIHNRVALFLIVAAPIVASPAICAHLLLSGAVAGFPVWPAVMCFALAAVFHYWGTKLLVGLYNGHIAFEASRESKNIAPKATPRAAPVVRLEAPAASGSVDLEPYTGTEPFIFVSYKRDDLERVRPILERVRGWGYRIWYDKGIPGGAEWDALIEQRLKDCILLLFFVSRESVESKYCRREVKYIDQLNKPILSVRLEPAELAHGLEMLLTQYQMIDAAAEDFSGEISRALKYLRVL